MGCSSKLKLTKPKQSYRATFEICSCPVEIGLYQLCRMKDWISSAIGEIEEQTKLDKKKRRSLKK